MTVAEDLVSQIFGDLCHDDRMKASQMNMDMTECWVTMLDGSVVHVTAEEAK